MEQSYFLGLDFGSDSVRCLVTDDTGKELSSAIAHYPRWAKGLYCNPEENRYRQHPLDYIEAMEKCIKEALSVCAPDVAANIKGIGYDTTASTPVLTDADGTPLSILPGFAENPDAMFILWKDHTAVREAEEINKASRASATDYTKYSGGSYSCEWVWAKVLHCLRNDSSLVGKACSWVEHCDWLGGILTGNSKPETMYRGRCTAGHKAMWNAEWGGLPPMDFFMGIDSLYGTFTGHLYSDTVTAGTRIGGLCSEWAQRLGLKEGTAVAMGAIDCHAGAVGAGIMPGTLVKVMGTSTCDIAVTSPKSDGNRIAGGICGQVDGSVIPGLIGYEAGQSAFGDIYAWYKRLLGWTLNLIPEGDREEIADKILVRLNEEASTISPSAGDPVALDWHNGRRTPDLKPNLKGGIHGLSLATSAPQIFKAFVEATAFGARAISERFEEEGITVRQITAVGGISKKSPYVMQVLADVLGMEIKVADNGQSCALGACIFAAAAAGIYGSIPEAQKFMQSHCSKTYVPDMSRHEIYNILYNRYKSFGNSAEQGGF